MVDARLGQRLQHCRERAGISQEDLANYVGVSITSISNIERGANYPSFENFIKILNYIGAAPNAVMVDIVECAQISRASELWNRMKDLSAEKKEQIFKIIEILLEA